MIPSARLKSAGFASGCAETIAFAQVLADVPLTPLLLDKRDDVLAINEGNLLVEDKATFVEVETAPQQFQKREIKTGLSDGINIEVVSGLKAEDKIKHR